MKSLLQDDDIEIYSRYNKRKSIVPQRFIRTLKKRVYKYISPISK